VSNYAVLRIRKRSLGAARAMAAHALRERPTPNADLARTRQNVTWPPGATSAAVIERLREMTEPLARRKDAVRCVELFIGASPEAMRGKTRAQQEDYLRQAVLWAAERFGGKRNVVLASIQFDELTPHAQVLLAPIERDAAGQAVRLAANRMIGGPAGLRRLQDEFAEAVGRPHELRRGERGSKAKHTSIRAFYGAVEAAGRADALPPRVPVPAPLPEPGLLSTTAARAAHAMRERERQDALDANRRRQFEIERLAGLAIATHGRGRRRLPKQLSQAEDTLIQAARARQELRTLERQRDELAREVTRLDARVQGLREQARGQDVPESEFEPRLR